MSSRSTRPSRSSSSSKWHERAALVLALAALAGCVSTGAHAPRACTWTYALDTLYAPGANITQFADDLRGIGWNVTLSTSRFVAADPTSNVTAISESTPNATIVHWTWTDADTHADHGLNADPFFDAGVGALPRWEDWHHLGWSESCR